METKWDKNAKVLAWIQANEHERTKVSVRVRNWIETNKPQKTMEIKQEKNARVCDWIESAMKHDWIQVNEQRTWYSPLIV